MGRDFPADTDQLPLSCCVEHCQVAEKTPRECGPTAKGCQRGSSGRFWRGDLQKTLSSTASARAHHQLWCQVTAGDKVEGAEPQAGAAVKHFHPFLLGKAQAGFTGPLCVGMGMI